MNTDQTKQDALLDAMFEVGAHFGYARQRRHPSSIPFIYGEKSAVQIIDLEKTAGLLARAEEFIESLARAGAVILFVGTKPEAKHAIEKAAESIGVPYVSHRWIGGTLTNFSEIKTRIARLEELSLKKEKGGLSMYTKKEQLLLDREREALSENFGGIAALKDLPAALFVVDSKAEEIAVMEARARHIPVVSLSNVDCDISAIDYPILGNDATAASVSFFVDRIATAYKRGKGSA